MSTPEKPTANGNAVDHELFLLGYRNLPVTGFGQVVLASLTAWGAHGTVPASTWQLWLAFMLLTGCVYWIEAWRFRAAARATQADPVALRQWRRHRRAIQFLSGMGWGGLGFLLVPGAEAHNILVMTSFAGMLGYSAAGNTANDFKGFSVTAAALTALLVSQLPRVFADQFHAIAAMCVLYVAALTVVVRNTHRSMRTSIELRLANEALARDNAAQAERADKANRDKSEFLAAASHDLRQPVHALLLLIEAYRQQDPVAARHPLLGHIAAAGQSISSLFNALMELSRLEGGIEKPASAPFDLGELLQRVLLRVHPHAERQALRLRSRLPRHRSAVAVLSDKLLVERIVANLVSNAVRYTARGGVLLALRRAHGGDGLWIEVWDTGIGIPADDLARVFEPYVQIGNRERDRTKGLGLGLAIVRQAARLLGLSVTVRSQPGRGSRFRVHIPGRLVQAVALAPALAQEQAQTLSASYLPGLAGRRILLVDDDPMVQQAMRSLLGGWRVDLRCAGRGDSSVLEACEQGWLPECVLSDFRLPGPLDGIGVLDMVLEHSPQAVGILLTGEQAASVQSLAEDAGYLVLGKPLEPVLLASTLGAVLERRSQARAT